jgi:hypothetical protein
MTGRVEKDPPPVWFRLALGLHRSDGEQLTLGGVEVGDVEIEMGLLGSAVRPIRCLVVRVALEGDVGSAVELQANPAPDRLDCSSSPPTIF